MSFQTRYNSEWQLLSLELAFQTLSARRGGDEEQVSKETADIASDRLSTVYTPD
jgi:hypothetical protein